jgi:hypothetical protein
MSPIESFDTNERIAVLETEVKNISINLIDLRREQKEQHQCLMEKFDKVEERISDIERWRWIVVGAALVIGYIIDQIIQKIS